MGYVKRDTKHRLDKFSLDPQKLHRLVRNKPNLSPNLGTYVVRALIKRKTRVVKIDPIEVQQKKNIDKILSLHSELIKKGIIRADSYRLARNPYLYVQGSVGVMRDLRGLSIRNLRGFLIANKQAQIGLAKEYPTLALFIKKHKITLKQVNSAETELIRDLEVIKNASTRISVDSHPTNFFVTGKTKDGKLIIAIIDQVNSLGVSGE